MLKNVVKHFNTINKHKWEVFKLCVKAGIPIRGLLHDLSKYSPEEFFESAKYYQGNRSPISKSQEVNGYSKAWLHHKGRNKHHYEYWYDKTAPDISPIIPYKYTVEMICDGIAAGMVYNGRENIEKYELEYFEKYKRNEVMLNNKLKDMLFEVHTQMTIFGIDKVINKKNLKELYNKHCK